MLPTVLSAGGRPVDPANAVRSLSSQWPNPGLMYISCRCSSMSTKLTCWLASSHGSTHEPPTAGNKRNSKPHPIVEFMTVWGAACWGLVGGVVVEALALYSLIRMSRHWSWRKPIPQGLAAYLISVVVRAGAGAGVAAAAAGSGQVSGTFAAFGLGIAAPLVVEKLARLVPLTINLTPTNQEPREPAVERPGTDGGQVGNGS